MCCSLYGWIVENIGATQFRLLRFQFSLFITDVMSGSE